MTRITGRTDYNKPITRVPTTGMAGQPRPQRAPDGITPSSKSPINRLPTAAYDVGYAVYDPRYGHSDVKQMTRLPNVRPNEHRTVTRVPTGPDHVMRPPKSEVSLKTVSRIATDIYHHGGNVTPHHHLNLTPSSRAQPMAMSGTATTMASTSMRKPLRSQGPTSASASPLASPVTTSSSNKRPSQPPSSTTVSSQNGNVLNASRLTLPSAPVAKSSSTRHIAVGQLSGGSNVSTATTPTAAPTTASSTFRSNVTPQTLNATAASGITPSQSVRTVTSTVYKQSSQRPMSYDAGLSPYALDPKASRELLNKRLDAKHLNAGQIIKEAPSQIKALCVSPDSGKCYKITRVLQSAIYGGVFEAEVYSIRKVLESPPNGPPPRPERRVALKIMLRDLEIQHRDSLQEDITAEFKFKNEMRGHPNVLAYDELWESRSKGIIYVVMPFAEFEDLFEVLKRRSVPFSEPEARWLFRQLLAGVQHLHDQGVGFRDHSLENVLMFRSEVDGTTLVPKITDPGQAVRIRYDTKRNEVCCLFAEKLFGKSFRPPEVYNPRKYNPIKVDVFCVGWMLFFVVTKRQPFDRTMDTDPHWKYVVKGQFEELLKIKGNAKLSAELISLLKNMLHPQYKHRYTPQQCLADPWFKGPEVSINERTVWTPNPHCTVGR